MENLFAPPINLATAADLKVDAVLNIGDIPHSIVGLPIANY
jgi:hypothetical protein